jgi:hypothetical protein
MEEVDAVNDAEKVNATIDAYRELISWCSGEKFIEGDCFKPIDTAELGNPLELDEQTIVKCIEILVAAPIVLED